MTRRSRIVLFAMACLAGTSGAWAATSVSAAATISNLRIELVDLNLDDGLDPWIAATGGGWSAVQVDAGRNNFGDLANLLRVGGFDGLPLYEDALSHSGADASGSATRSTNGLDARATTTAGVSTNAYAWFETSIEYAQNGQGDVRTGLFEIGPWTGLRLVADGQVTMTSSPAWRPGDFQWASASLHGAVGTVQLEDITRDQLLLGGSYPTAMNVSGELSIALANPSDTAQPLMLGGMASTSLMLAPVPEPGSAGMALGGLLLLAAVRRRLKG